MQHSIWHKVPVVRLLLAFASGIGTSMFYSVELRMALSLVAAFFLPMIFMPLIFKAYQQRWFSGVATIMLFYSAGIFINVFQKSLSDPDHFVYVPHTKTYVAMVAEEPVERANSFKMKTRVIQCIDSSGNTRVSTGNILLYVSKDSSAGLPQYGDVLLISASQTHEVMPPKNPDEFDYRRYLAFNHIHHQVYLKAGKVLKTGLNEGSAVMKSIYSIQHYFKQTLDEYVKTPGEVGVAQALLYGFDDNIDEATMNAYANTGTLHVLAVSGMHVGLIFFLLGKTLFFMDKNKKLLLAKRLIILIALWVYSALCGLSPSILRATVMFSFVIVAQMLNRKSNIYNTLAASCFALLCYDSNMLANVGFQLSYMAVIGIVFVQPLIEKWWTPPNWFMRQVWSITCVSIAAQLATLPIGILYFHQFPFCFLFSNLLIIPLTTLIIYVTIGLLAVSWWPLVASFVGLSIQQLILFTNKIVMLLEIVPYSYINGLQISISQSIMLYIFILSMIFYFMHRYVGLFKVMIVSALGFIIVSGISFYETGKQSKIVVYSVSNNNAIHLINGKRSTLYIDDALRYDKQKFRFHLQQHIWKCGLEKIDTVSHANNWQLLKAGQRQFVLSGEKGIISYNNVDVLIIRNNISVEAVELLKPGFVVISSKLKHYQIQKLKEHCVKSGIPHHDVLNSGAYELSL